MGWLGVAFLLGTGAVFGLTFGAGHVLLAPSPWRGLLLILLGATAAFLTLYATGRSRSALEPQGTTGDG